MNFIKRLVGFHWVPITLVLVCFLSGAGNIAAQEIKGHVITEDGEVLPVEKTTVLPDQEGYFIQPDAEKAVREINAFHMLGLSESKIIQLSNLLKNEVYPKYSKSIPDLKQFFMDVNETLGLGLSEEQIDLQVEEITRPEDPGDFEIPLRPPTSSLNLPEIGRVPSDESAPYLTKKNRLFLFFVNDSGTANNWTDAQKQTARSRVEESET
ncbi:MAG: hypothetical protein KJO26_08265, partial [Deltaproteobacteria bacterium]|nr:hypothetical protein [Deltaproteobacteria bacterium]